MEPASLGLLGTPETEGGLYTKGGLQGTGLLKRHSSPKTKAAAASAQRGAAYR